MTKREEMEAVLRRYFEGCNEADVDKVASCFLPDAVHYFPPGMYGGTFDGGRTIGERWAAAVRDLGSQWVLERIAIDVDANSAVGEWTHYKTKQGTVLRGDEWYEFDPATGLISEIRAYYASPQARDLERLELAGFDYAGRGYSTEPKAREGAD
jgi:hypothetical protein